jgi:hypothetical protein
MVNHLDIFLRPSSENFGEKSNFEAIFDKKISEISLCRNFFCFENFFSTSISEFSTSDILFRRNRLIF